MKKYISFFTMMMLLYSFGSAQELKLNYPFPEKQIERFLVLPEKLDTLTTDYFFLYQFRLKNGKAVDINLVNTYPKTLPEIYQKFADDKLKSIDFTNVVYNPDIEWYGTSLMLKLKPKKYSSWLEQKLTYDQRLDYVVMQTARLAGLKAEDYNYIKPKYPDMLLQIVIGKNMEVAVHNLYEDPDTNKDERYWKVFNEIVDQIREIKLPPNTTEGDEFNIRLDFYKKLEWKSE